MPCNDGGVPYTITSRDPGPPDTFELRGMLCEALQLLEEHYDGNSRELLAVLKDRDPRLVAFYKSHTKEEDAKIRKAAAKKLSARERRVLGIADDGRPLKAPKR